MTENVAGKARGGSILRLLLRGESLTNPSLRASLNATRRGKRISGDRHRNGLRKVLKLLSGSSKTSYGV